MRIGAIWAASRPTTMSVASITYHCGAICPAFAWKQFIAGGHLPGGNLCSANRVRGPIRARRDRRRFAAARFGRNAYPNERAGGVKPEWRKVQEPDPGSWLAFGPMGR